MKRSSKYLIVGMIVVTMALGNGALTLAHGGDINLIHACVKISDGSLRIVGATDICEDKKEVPLDWSIIGPPGPQGPEGPQGLQGPVGPQGPSTAYQNVIVVAKSGGDFTSIQEALNSITEAGAENPYLVWVAPGTYTEQVTMKPFVDIEGAGELTTKITRTNNYTPFIGKNYTLKGASNAELRFLMVENIGGSEGVARAILNEDASLRLTHVTVTATGGTSNYGVFNSGALSTMTDVIVLATGSSDADYGVYNSDDSMLTIRNSEIHGGYGIFNVGSSFLDVHNSQIAGLKSAIHNDYNSRVDVGASWLNGDESSGTGFVRCAGVYDEAYIFYANTCP